MDQQCAMPTWPHIVHTPKAHVYPTNTVDLGMVGAARGVEWTRYGYSFGYDPYPKSSTSSF